MCNVNVPYVMKKLRHLHHSPVLQHNTLNLMATLMGENVKFPWWLNFFPHPCRYFLVTIVVSFTCPCLEHATYKSSSLSSTTSWASTTISIFNQFFSFIKTHVWCKHSSLDTLDLVFGGFFVQLQVIGLFFMHLQCGDWLYVLFMCLDQWNNGDLNL